MTVANMAHLLLISTAFGALQSQFMLSKPTSAFIFVPATACRDKVNKNSRLDISHVASADTAVTYDASLWGKSATKANLDPFPSTMFSPWNSTDFIYGEDQSTDKRPHEQRVLAPRKARRLNHGFQHLYRHSDSRWDDNDWNHDEYTSDIWLQSSLLKNFIQRENTNCSNSVRVNSTNNTCDNQKVDFSVIHYLIRYGGYTWEEIQQMQAQFPPLLEMDVIRHIRPKMRFLKDCLQGEIEVVENTKTRRTLHPLLKAILPANFFGARLEKSIAPRHAFLIHMGLPHGRELWYHKNHTTHRDSMFIEFLAMHRKPKQFAAMCNDWRIKYGSTKSLGNPPITSDQIIAFDRLFQRGLLSAARNDTAYIFPDEILSPEKHAQAKHTVVDPISIEAANATSSELIQYLIQHGGNPWEEDARGASLFHWAAGSGNLEGLKTLVRCCNDIDSQKMGKQDQATNSKHCHGNAGIHAALLWKASRDHATPLHWAAAGVGPKEFGTGGHLPVCTYLMSLCADLTPKVVQEKEFINARTKDGNSILMWAAWSRSTDIVKLLVRHCADTTIRNRNGCTVAHWAASGGSLSVCKYLAQMANVDFSIENYSGNSPLAHAVAYGRVDVVKWLRCELKIEDKGQKAEGLAIEFVDWAESGLGLMGKEEEENRKKICNLLKDWREEMEGNSEGRYL